MPEKKKTAAAAPAVEAPAAEAKESKTRKSAKAPARRGRPPLAPELYVEFSGKQYNVTDIIDRAKADYRATHKVGVQRLLLLWKLLPLRPRSLRPVNLPRPLHAAAVPRLHRSCTWSSAANSTT